VSIERKLAAIMFTDIVEEYNKVFKL